MIVCRRWKESIHLLVGGHLDESSRPALLRHMEECDKCRNFCQDLQKIEAALRAPISEKDLLSRSQIRSIVERSLPDAIRKPIPARRAIVFFPGPRIAWGFAATLLVFLSGYGFHELLKPQKISSPPIASDVPDNAHAKPEMFAQTPAKTVSRPTSQSRPAKSGVAPMSPEDIAAEGNYAIANRLLKRRNFAGAAAALQKVLAVHEAKHEKAMLDLAYCYSMLGQPQRALPIYRAVANGSRDPKAVETAYNWIDSLLEVRLNAYAAAEEERMTAVRNNPAGRWGKRGTYYLVQMPIRKEDSAKVDCLLEPFRREIPYSNQAPGMSPQIINVSSPWIGRD